MLQSYVNLATLPLHQSRNKSSSKANTAQQIHNPSVATLYEDALVYEQGSAITVSGALSAYSGKKTGRSPQDKRIVKEPSSENDVWWGPVNKPMSPDVSLTVSCPLTDFPNVI